MLYTVVPPEELFLDEGDPPALVEGAINGVRVLVAPLGHGLARIERLLSTDPDHFLDPRLQPGSIVAVRL